MVISEFEGILVGAATFLIIGVCHPIVIKAEYYFGTGCWWVFLLVGLACCAASIITGGVISILLAVVGFSSFWSIYELFEQKKRVARGWFPKNPKRLGILLLAVSLSCTLSAQDFFPKSKASDTHGIMSDAYWNIWNDKVNARIDADIDANRKADAVINASNLPKGTEITVEQISHSFVFGAQIFNFNQLGSNELNEKYRNLYGTLFNSATIPFYWSTFETEPDRLRFATEYWDTEEFWNRCSDPFSKRNWRRPSTDQIVEFCESRGIRMHGHTLIWGQRTWGQPEWLLRDMVTPAEKAAMDSYVDTYVNPNNNGKDAMFSDHYRESTAEEISASLPVFAKTLDSLFAKRITDIASHYGGRIDSWDVVNESASDFHVMNPGGILIKSRYGIMPADYTYKAFQTALKAFPETVQLNINDWNLRQEYVDQVNDLTARGCRVDIMGSQMHLFDPNQCLQIAQGDTIQTPAQIWKWTDRLSKAGKPIHLSEITISAPGNDDRGRQIQAVITYNLYRLWFSIKPMMGITWWNVVDDCGGKGEPTVSGLFDRQMNPKTSYYALDDLINHEWHTVLTVRTTGKRQINFRGFKGKYRITWTDSNGDRVSREFQLLNDGDTVTL